MQIGAFERRSLEPMTGGLSPTGSRATKALTTGLPSLMTRRKNRATHPQAIDSQLIDSPRVAAATKSTTTTEPTR